MNVREKRIKDDVYVINTLGARKGLEVLTELTKIVGPALISKGSGLTVEGLTSAVKELSSAQVLHVITTFAECTIVKRKDGSQISLGVESIFDAHFSGSYSAMWLWVKECLDLNYADFLAELGLQKPSTQKQEGK